MSAPLHRLLLALALLFGASTVLPACGGENGINLLGNKNEGKKKKKAVDEGDDDGAEEEVVTHNIDNSGTTLQVKDTITLRNSIEACMGSGMLTVHTDMILPLPTATGPAPSTAAAADGRIAFLLPGSYADKDDIIKKVSKDLVDPNASGRTTVAADGVTDTYLRALELVANVVAHNCSEDKEECRCGTKKEVKAMIERCIPRLDPDAEEVVAVRKDLVKTCQTPGGMRTVIASLLASYAFAAAR